jgi:serine/threonine-protein kinase
VNKDRILAEALVGRWLKGKYRFDRVIGFGGMAVVYGGLHRNGKRVAIKLLLAECADEPLIVERFVREGYAANAVDHDGVVRVDDDDVSEDGRAFLVMELLDGVSLEELRTQQGGKLAAGLVLALGYQLLDVLVAAHAKGIIHRDIKPANLFLTKKGELKVLDFGIARFRDGKVPRTITLMRMGTPAYAAPEQMLGNQNLVDARADLFATGATLFHLLTGTTPRDGAVTVRSLAELLPNTDPALVALIDRSLQEKREDRWSDAVTMRSALVETYAHIESGSVATGKQLLEQMRFRASERPASRAARAVSAAAFAPTVPGHLNFPGKPNLSPIYGDVPILPVKISLLPDPLEEMRTSVSDFRGVQPSEPAAATLIERARPLRKTRVLWLLGGIVVVVAAVVLCVVLLLPMLRSAP